MRLSLERRLAVSAALLALTAGVVPATAAYAAPVTQPAAAAPTAQSQQVTPDMEALAKALQSTLDAGAPGALARYTGPDGVKSKTLGIQDTAHGTPMDVRSRFRIGSVSKTFSSVVLLQLVNEGRVDLDTPVNQYLPRLLPDDRITVRHLLTHRSGLSDYTNAMFENTVPGFEAVRNKVFSYQELVDLSLAEPRTAEPGVSYSYSNTNFVVVGMIIEKVTGKPVEKEYDRRIIKPLKLRNTSYVHPSTVIRGRHAHGYLHPDEDGQPLVDSTEQTVSWAQTAGAVISNAADLSTFMSGLVGGKLLPARMLDMMTTMTPTDAAKTRFYGLGLRRYDLSCGTQVFGHTGTVQGFYTYAFTTRDGKRSLSAMANTSNDGAANTALGGTLEAAFCGKPAAPKSNTAARGPASAPTTAPAPAPAEKDLPERR
ncbi:serine hydrolase domain-containing protein [Streptomyces sp. NPDC002138]|uniref:serine hydrolase domain-containing protein n=1 Tax=Streptomyces sp. NPDC002138 TaxID=3154410 RepID=UPI00332E7CC5